MKFAIALSLLVSGALASADQFKTVTVDASTAKSESTYSYPELFAGSVPAYASINAQIKDSVEDGQCGEPQEPEQTYYYGAEAKVVALNKRYVGVQITGDQSCGGAHPNYFTYFLTFDANTGNALNIEKEFGITEDWETNQVIQAKLAKLLAGKLPADDGDEAGGCFEGLKGKDLEDQLVQFYPVVHGLAKNKTVVLGIMPPHVATVCRFEARFSYAEIKPLLIPGSFLNKLLQ